MELKWPKKKKKNPKSCSKLKGLHKSQAVPCPQKRKKTDLQKYVQKGFAYLPKIIPT